MTLRKFSTLLFILALFGNIGCMTDNKNLQVVKNDTTEVLRLLIDSAFYRQNLPDLSRLTRNNPFDDTIIFKYDSVIVGHLPTNLNFKILTEEQICSLATQYYNDTALFCSFLEIRNFEKSDSTFEVSLRNECVMPLYDRTGKLIFKKDFYDSRANFKCMFGFMCGGGIGMMFTKHADSFKANIESISSD